MKPCKNCGGPIGADKRKDTECCSPTCKAQYHEKQKKLNGKGKSFGGLKLEPEQEPEQKQNGIEYKTIEKENLEPLQNILNGSQSETTQSETKEETNITLPPQHLTKVIKEGNVYYLWVKKDLDNCRADIKKCTSEIDRINQLIEKEKNRNGTGIYLTSGGTGAFIGYNVAPDKKVLTSIKSKKKTPAKASDEGKGKKILYTILGGLLGLGVGKIIDSGLEDQREKEKIANIKKYQQKVQEWQTLLKTLKQNESELWTKLAKYPPTTDKEQKVLNPAYTEALKQLEAQRKSNVSQSDQSFYENLKGVNTEKTNPLETDKILSAKNMVSKQIPLLNFKGRWQELIGNPQTNFFMVVHGMSGEGKTHFTIQLAKYLAENFGNVLYVSGEEGFAPTFQNKIKALGAQVGRLLIGDFRTGEELLEEVPNKYHFIVIDSTNNMEIDPNLMKAIRQRFKQSGFIAVAQSTKDDKIRGSYQIVHDSDITVKVKDGIAITTKNRFKEKGTQFDVFAVYKQNKPKSNGNNNYNNDKLDEDFRNTIK